MTKMNLSYALQQRLPRLHLLRMEPPHSFLHFHFLFQGWKKFYSWKYCHTRAFGLLGRHDFEDSIVSPSQGWK